MPGLGQAPAAQLDDGQRARLADAPRAHGRARTGVGQRGLATGEKPPHPFAGWSASLMSAGVRLWAIMSWTTSSRQAKVSRPFLWWFIRVSIPGVTWGSGDFQSLKSSPNESQPAPKQPTEASQIGRKPRHSKASLLPFYKESSRDNHNRQGLDKPTNFPM